MKTGHVSNVEFVSRPNPPEPTEEGAYVLAGSRIFVRNSINSSSKPWREVNTNARYSWNYITMGRSGIKILAEVDGNKFSDKVKPEGPEDHTLAWTVRHYEGLLADSRERARKMRVAVDKIADVLDEFRGI